MAELGLDLVEGLLNACGAEEADKPVLKNYFQQHLQGQDRRGLASHVLETVLQHIKSDGDVTGLHREVLAYLIKTLGEETNGHAPQVPEHAKEIHEAGGHGVASDSDHDVTPKAPKREKSKLKQKQKLPVKQKESPPVSSGMPDLHAFPPVVTEQQKYAARRKQFLQEMCGDIESPPRQFAQKSTMNYSPSLTAELERRRASSPVDGPWNVPEFRPADRGEDV
ncbi:uncharacterized protein F4807DRAFT_461052 [Annulohypoxylon truncatum]|uniref:uncharacterized protein n=1 Tax=Annulohypoxylon truncatum TaxID=327061 RepID=UPI0020086AA8|nr:uncharacterized protein F4807DRAFT_461052 [Annulohypoxylon truncatum]KAI1208930.1 hypothetical protein F4807DRAFT_461052 [Annulohypoxylon truncatum]